MDSIDSILVVSIQLPSRTPLQSSKRKFGHCGVSHSTYQTSLILSGQLQAGRLSELLKLKQPEVTTTMTTTM